MTRRANHNAPAAVILAAALIAATALAVVGVRSPSSVFAQPICLIEFSLPSGSSAQIQPGNSFTFPFSVSVRSQDVQEISVQVTFGPTSGLLVAVQPEFTSFSNLPVGAPQTNQIFGGITVSVPGSFAPGNYTVSGIGAIATCRATDAQGNVSTLTPRTSAEHLVITVPAPLPTPTPQPEPTSTPIPPPAICEPGFSFIGSSSLEASAGDEIVIPFEASVVVRRVTQVTLTAVTTYQGAMQVTIDPASSNFTFDPLPADTVLRTFTGNVRISVPANQPPGTYGINGFLAQATCQGVDTAGSPTTFQASSGASNITVRLLPLTPTPQPASTATTIPSPTPEATMTPTVIVTPPATATPTAPPTQSPTSIPRATATAGVMTTQTPTTSATGTATLAPTQTATAGPTSTPDPTATPRSIVRPPLTTATATVSSVEQQGTPGQQDAAATNTPTDGTGSANGTAGSTTLVWQESRTLFAEEDTGNDWVWPLAGLLAAMLIAGGAAGVWYSRSR